MSEEKTNKTIEKPWLFQKGNPGSPGRPKGKTIKERVREWLEENPDDMKAFVDHFVKKNKELAWQMLEGRPQQDVVSDGKALGFKPFDDVQENNNLQTNQDLNKED